MSLIIICVNYELINFQGSEIDIPFEGEEYEKMDKLVRDLYIRHTRQPRAVIGKLLVIYNYHLVLFIDAFPLLMRCYLSALERGREIKSMYF